jgi:ferrochelatase
MSRPLLLYVNLGTPASTDVKDVRNYLREFLSDPLVLDIPGVLRWPLVNLIIAPTRAAKSAAAYKKVWSREGSPLLFHSRNVVEKIKRRLQSEVDVELVMRYGSPGVEEVLKKYLNGPTENWPSRIYVMPAYPQYALSSTETALQKVRGYLLERNYRGSCDIICHYETFMPFVKAVSTRVKTVMNEKKSDHLLFSFHGLPMRQIAKVSPDLNYRDQCYATARAVAEQLGLSDKQYTVGFQSRLGTGWIKPFSDELYPILSQQGKKRLAVVCPSFTADCLETLEEVAIRGKETFLASGGEDLTLVPCVNDGDDWVEGAVELFKTGPWRAINA